MFAVENYLLCNRCQLIFFFFFAMEVLLNWEYDVNQNTSPTKDMYISMLIEIRLKVS